MADDSPKWEQIQKKTFTKWINSHLKREWGTEKLINDILCDWETGLSLMHLAVALYKENEKNPEQAISMPKLRKNEENPKNRIQMVNNGGKALDLLKKAGVDLRGVSAENLVDHDKIAILGMVWMIILDYAARGFGGTAAEVKRALLEWVNKKTDGYERVNPPGVKNFTKDWRSGLAWCALIARHRPELLNYQDCLDKSNAENLETAFSLAEGLGIPRLLDVEDVDTEAPDEKSIMTYVMEYFHCFAGDALREAAAKQVADWLKFMRDVVDRQNDYERRARALLALWAGCVSGWNEANFGDTLEEAQNAFNDLRTYIKDTKPEQDVEKMDLEALFAEIQTTRSVNGLGPYVPPEDVLPEALDTEAANTTQAQQAHAQKVRENRFRFIEKKEDTGAAEVEAQIAESFKRYDDNGNGSLNRSEFDAAVMEMGIALKTQEEKDALFQSVAKGDDTVTFEEYRAWMTSRLLVNLSDPEGIKAAFRSVAGDANGLTEGQLGTDPLTPEDVAFLKEQMPKDADGNYDYNAFVDAIMK